MHSQHQFQWYPKHLYLEEIDMLNAPKKRLKPPESIFFYLPGPQKVEYQLTMLAALQSCWHCYLSRPALQSTTSSTSNYCYAIHPYPQTKHLVTMPY
jgi:hypothetical protein